MQLDKVVSWYQKKISTYDKQQWEKTVEQRILMGFVHVPLKNTELKTELIDVDLVRGSSFPKAKPKQGLLTVLKLSILRYVFLPLYARWWVEQTSPKIFTGLLVLYVLQMFNWGVYSYHVHRIGNTDEPHIVSVIEFVVPMALSLVLSMIHSQIVATTSINADATGKRKPMSLQTRKRHRERVRKKRKSNNPSLRRGSDIKMALGGDHQADLNMGTVYIRKPSFHAAHNGISSLAMRTPSPAALLFEHAEEDGGLRKRNVNFNSVNLENTAKTVGSRGRPEVGEVRMDSDDVVGVPDDGRVPVAGRPPVIGCDDDGFESLNGKSSSSEENHQQQRSDLNADSLFVPSLLDAMISPIIKSIEFKSDSSPLDSSFGQTPPPAAAVAARQPIVADSTDTDEEGNDDEADAMPASSQCSGGGGGAGAAAQFTEGTTSATEWIGITTNSEDGSYNSSELNESDSQLDGSENGGEYDFTPTVILNPCCGTSDRISCTIWERGQTKKAEMSVLDISSAIIERVEAMPETCDYVYIGVALSIVLSIVPAFCRLCEAAVALSKSTDINILDIPLIFHEHSVLSTVSLFQYAFGMSAWEQTVLGVSFGLRISLTFLFFFMLAVSERTFKQRFLYAKLFSHLTSSRRARKSKVPHFRLNKVRNIKIWLSVRSYLKRRGPQRSVDVIVSAAFILTLLFLAFLSVEFLKDSVHLQSQYNLEALIWSCCLGCFLLRFMTLGTKINRKYRSLSVLITEQINLYLQIEQKPKKKEELMVANSVLKLAADLLKELESPFKISGLSANPYLYTTIKVVILSALSGVLSEMLGFKLKLHKIKIK